MRVVSPFSFVDLFCGAGGMSSGFIAAGFRPMLAIDNARPAVETYERNLGPHVRLEAITETVDLPDATVFVGGPPCQGFSTAGMRRSGDSRNSLVSCYATLICKYLPRAFVFENVEGFLTAENGDRVFDLLVPVVRAGYRVHLRKINAAHYGVPQHRKRVIAIGGLGWDPIFPEPTHSASGAPGATLVGRHLPPTPTLEMALRDMPPPATEPPGVPQGHYYRPLEGMDLARAHSLRPGQTMRDLPSELWHESYARRAYRRVQDGTPTERRGGPPAGIKRLLPHQPSKTITSGATSEFLHPSQDRPLTLRECAELQTFPETFEFCGSAGDQALLIGNAVPPRLGRILGEAVLTGLNGARQQTARGELLSFVPTESTGMSPALKRLTDRVYSTFSVAALCGTIQARLWA